MGKPSQSLPRRDFLKFGLRKVEELLLLDLSLRCASASPPQKRRETSDWPMLAHDPTRSGATLAEVRPPFERKWYRLFPEEGLMSGVQPVVAGGKVFIGTLAGVLHALEENTGKDLWTFQAGGPILHTCAVAGERVIFGSAEGKIYAVDISKGRLSYTLSTDGPIWNAPAISQEIALIGSRDGYLYALDHHKGQLLWKARTGGPLLSSPAVDIRRERVYVASEDMRVYAFSLQKGQRIWRSNPLPGVSFRGYHPVIAPDGSVMITVTPALSQTLFEPLLLDMVKEIFGDFASWRHTPEENARIREENFKLMENPETYRRQLDYLRKRLTEQPAYQTFFVLDPETGRQKFVTPIVYAESMNGTGAPPIVTPEGKVIVKYQVLLRSRYEHYSPFLNVGYLDTSTGDITPIMDQSRTYGWHDSLLLVHDEQCQLVVGGRVLINTHQNDVNGMDLDTLEGYPQPFCRNLHEPGKEEMLGIWEHLLRGQLLPVGKEWLPRGTAVYGGGSVIDTSVVIAGDSFYYIPTHEINAGVALIAYKEQKGGTASQQRQVPVTSLTDKEWKQIQQMPWDWDLLEMPRLNRFLESLPGKVPGTRQQPLKDQAEKKVASLPDEDWEAFLWEIPVVSLPQKKKIQQLQSRLEHYVQELISQEWRPLVFPAGKHPVESYRFFLEPTETLYTLARAYPYLKPSLQQSVKQYVAERRKPGGPLEGPLGQKAYSPHQGKHRSFYSPPPEELMVIQNDILRSEVARLYPVWLWSYNTDDGSWVEEYWTDFRRMFPSEPNRWEEDCWNGYLGGLIAFCRMAKQKKDGEALEQGLALVRKFFRQRLIYELAHPRGGLITQVPHLRTIFARWRHLTPEVGRFLATYAGEIHQNLMKVYVDYHRPTWWLAWNVELLWRNEAPFAFPTMSMEIFSARVFILREPAEKLLHYLDLPWCRADLFYIQKLVMIIEALGKVDWRLEP